MSRARRIKPTMPCILIVDDKLEDAEARRLSFLNEADALARTPSDVTARDLRRADVVLIDFALHDWEIDPAQPIAAHPNNGVALAAVFRSHSSANSQKAFALHSGRLDGL